MWNYFPRLPTQFEWNNRIFTNKNNTEEIIQAMKEKNKYFRGQILFIDKERHWLDYNSVAHLKMRIKDIKNESLIDRIYIYGIGYFINRT